MDVAFVGSSDRADTNRQSPYNWDREERHQRRSGADHEVGGECGQPSGSEFGIRRECAAQRGRVGLHCRNRRRIVAVT